VNTFWNIVRTVIITSMAVSCLSVAQEKEQKAGEEAYNSGDYLKAIEMFREVTKKEKQNPVGFLWLAKALVKADSLNEATVPLTLAKAYDANNPATYILQGDVYLKQRIYAAAIGEYQKAIELDPKNLDAWLKLAEAQKKSRLYNDAVKTYQTLLILDSMNVTALHELGTVLFRGKQYLRALDYIEKLTKLFPDSLDYQVKYVKCLFEAKRYQDLLPIAERLVENDPSLIEIQEILDEVYAKLKMNRKIIDSYNRRNLDSLKIDDLIRYVRALQSEQVHDTAEVVYRMLFRRDTVRCDMRYYFGTNEMKLKKWTEAVEQFEKQIECDTSVGFKFASHLNAAMSLMQLKKFKEAIGHTKKAIDYRPDNVQAWQVLAQCYGQLEQISDEIAAYKKVIELATAANSNGDEGKYNDQLQEAYRMIGVRLLIEATKDTDPKTNKPKYAAAADYLKKAIQLKPNDCEALLWVAQAYQNSNNKEEAKRYYKKLLDTCPKSKDVEKARQAIKDLG